MSTRATALLQRGLQHRGYLQAVGSSYLLMAVAIVSQVLLVPLYLHAFGQYQFGVLMILLGLVNFAIIGIAWISGGAMRLLGEYAGLDDARHFRRAFGLIKTIYIGYGLALAVLAALVAWWFAGPVFSEATPADLEPARWALALTGVYLVVFYGIAIDRIALTARRRQGTANMVQLLGMIVSSAASALWVLMDGAMPGILACQIAGTLVASLLARRLLDRELPGLRLAWPRAGDRPLLRRLGGATGAGFFLHGALVLGLQADIAIVSWLGGARLGAEFFLVWKIAEVLVQLLWKLPEPLQPYFIHMDVRKDHESLMRIARLGYLLVGSAALVTGVLYALFGHALVTFWVGAQRAPDQPLAYALAGGAIFWLGLSRLPVVLAGARVTLRRLNIAASADMFCKLAIAILLFPRFGFTAMLLGINLAHLCGVSVLYFRLLSHPPATPIKEQ